MFHSLFNPENTFWRWMAGLADILVLSVLWLLCSVPVVTVGAATAALYDACARGMRGGRGDAWRRFFHTFRAELKTATIACAIWEALLLVLFWVLRRLWAAALALGLAFGALIQRFGPKGAWVLWCLWMGLCFGPQLFGANMYFIGQWSAGLIAGVAVLVLAGLVWAVWSLLHAVVRW